MNSSDFKEQILVAVPIENYIGRFVALKKKGRTYSGLCPFHNEKTPSFTVNPEKGLFHCFGCGKGGDLFTFVMDIEGIGFAEALDTLGRFAGIERQVKNSRESDEHKRLATLNERVLRHYYDYLRGDSGSGAREYLKSRGIPSETLDHFEVGATPDSWRFITELIPEASEELTELGLIRESKGRVYDLFRNRIMFPIRDLQGRVVGFGGRALPGQDDSIAKYINSPESRIYQKSRILYGLYQSLPAIRSAGEAVIVEGYLDVVGLFDAGIKNCAAPLGTALTLDHLNLLKRYTERVTILMDGDRAGRSAAFKFAKIALSAGSIRSRVVLLPQGLDPFDLSRNSGEKQIQKILERSIPTDLILLQETLFPDWFELHGSQWGGDPLGFAEKAREFFSSGGRESGRTLEERRESIDRLFDFLETVQRSTDRDLLLEESGRILGLNPASLMEEWHHKKGGRQRFDPVSHPATRESRREPPRKVAHRSPEERGRADTRLLRGERDILRYLIHHPHLIGEFHESLSTIFFQQESHEILWRYMESRYFVGDLWTPESLIQAELPDQILAEFGEIFLDEEKEIPPVRPSFVKDPGPADLLLESIDGHRLLSLENESRRLSSAVAVADSLEKVSLLEKLGAISKEIRKLKDRRSGQSNPG